MFAESVVWSNSYMSRQRMFLIKANWYLVRHLASHMHLFFHIDYSLGRQPISSQAHFKLVTNKRLQLHMNWTRRTASILKRKQTLLRHAGMKVPAPVSFTSTTELWAPFLSLLKLTPSEGLWLTSVRIQISTWQPHHSGCHGQQTKCQCLLRNVKRSKSSQIVLRLLAGTPTRPLAWRRRSGVAGVSVHALNVSQFRWHSALNELLMTLMIKSQHVEDGQCFLSSSYPREFTLLGLQRAFVTL